MTTNLRYFTISLIYFCFMIKCIKNRIDFHTCWYSPHVKILCLIFSHSVMYKNVMIYKIEQVPDSSELYSLKIKSAHISLITQVTWLHVDIFFVPVKRSMFGLIVSTDLIIVKSSLFPMWGLTHNQHVNRPDLIFIYKLGLSKFILL